MATPDKLNVLSTDKKARKETPVATGVLDYFPDAIAAIAHLSWVGNQQHNPGKPIHWDREKSTDHADCLLRHFLERGTVDTDGVGHSVKVAWRALALLQVEIELQKAPAFDKHLEAASKVVQKWPRWKQGLLGGPTVEPQVTNYCARARELSKYANGACIPMSALAKLPCTCNSCPRNPL